MPEWLLVAIILIVGCFASAYVTERICSRKIESEWQEISYTGDSVEPKEIYICKRCNKKVDLNSHYCCNCGSLMKNGISYNCYSDKIDLSNWEE